MSSPTSDNPPSSGDESQPTVPDSSEEVTQTEREGDGPLREDAPKTAVHNYPYQLKPGTRTDEYRELGLTFGLISLLGGALWMAYSGVTVTNAGVVILGGLALYFWFPLDELQQQSNRNE